MSAAEGKAGAFSKSVTGFLEQAGRRAFDALVSGAQQAVQAMGDAVTASSDLSESINKAGVLFGNSTQKVLAFADTADKSLGQSKQQALDAAATFATFGRAAGLSGDALVKFSTDFDGLASDLASFNNTTPQEAITAIGAGLRGESEPLRRFGVLLDDATLRQKALELGIVSTTANALTPQQRVLAAQVAIYQQTSAAQGDFARTSTGLANAQRILAAEAENGSAKLGNIFRPAVESITNSLVGLAPQMFGYATNIMDQFASGIAAGIRALTPAIMVVRQLFAYWFAPGSPPRVIPDIDKWGAAAMGQFLSGFSSVDVKRAFDAVGSAIEGILRSNVAAGKGSESNLVGSIFGTRDAITKAVSEFASAGSVSEATINRITRAAGVAGPSISALVKAYFNLQTATTAATRAQDDLNRITERYDAILNPLQDKLDTVRGEQRKLADQQRLIAAQNVLTNFDSTAAEKRAAQLEIEQISLEDQISGVEQKKKTETDAAQAQLDAAKKQQDAAQKQLDVAQATIDQQVSANNLIAERIQLEQRLASEQQAAADKAQAEADKQARLAEQLHQAQLQYTLGIENTQQKIATLQGELARTTVGSVEYYNILGQIKALEKQAADEAQRDKDKVNSAQLDYNLSLADTAGKIAIWQQELAKATPGTAEYFNILTKIHDLNVSLAKEGAKGGAGDIGASLALPDLSTLPKLEPTPGGKSLADALKGLSAPIGEASDKVKALGDSIKELVTTFGTLFGIDFTKWLDSNKAAVDTTGWDMYGEVVAANTATAQQNADTAAAAMKKSVDDTTLTLRTLQSDAKVIMDLLQGNWQQFWIDWNENVRLGNQATDNQFDESTANWLQKFQHWELEQGIAFRAWIGENAKDLGGWLTDTSAKFGQWLTDTASSIDNMASKFFDGGANLIGQFWDGLKSKWGELSSWFTTSLAGLRAQLPFSEPKDPSSPLRGLGKSGESMINIIQGGMDKAALTVRPLAQTLLEPATNNTTNSTANNMVFNINIGSGATAGEARSGAKNGVLDALRAVGMA